MKRNNSLYILIAVLVLLNISTLGYLWSTKKGERVLERNRRPHRTEAFFERKLELNKEQVLQFDKSRKAHFSKTEELRVEIGELRMRLNKVMRLSQEEKVEIIIEEIGKKQIEIELLNYKHFNELRNFCNSKQKVIFDSIFTEMTHRPRRRPHGRH